MSLSLCHSDEVIPVISLNLVTRVKKMFINVILVIVFAPLVHYYCYYYFYYYYYYDQYHHHYQTCEDY